MAAKNFVIAKRYARALWALCDQGKTAPAVVEPLHAVALAVQTSSELKFALASASFSVEQKTAILKDILSKVGGSELLLRFVSKLASAHRLGAIIEIEATFRSMVLNSQGVQEATIESALALSPAQIEKIVPRLEKLAGTKLTVTTSVNPALIAGLRAHVGGKTYDATFSSNLSGLKKSLLESEV